MPWVFQTVGSVDDTSKASGGHVVLANADVSTRLPAKDLERARKFYSEKLGLEPVRREAWGSSLPMRWWLLRPVRIRGFRFGYPHANGVGARHLASSDGWP